MGRAPKSLLPSRPSRTTGDVIFRPWEQHNLGLPLGSCPGRQTGPCREDLSPAALPSELSPPVTKNRSLAAVTFPGFVSYSLSLGDICGEMSINNVSGGCAVRGWLCRGKESFACCKGQQEPPAGTAFPCEACPGIGVAAAGRGQPEGAPVPASLTARAASCPPSVGRPLGPGVPECRQCG